MGATVPAIVLACVARSTGDYKGVWCSAPASRACLLLEVDVGLLHLLHEAGDVALAEHPTHERLDLEVLEVLDVLPRAHVRDGRAGGRDGR
eukprot:scaffold48678_cov36-Phaeocystis_antarctica.AAC.1